MRICFVSPTVGTIMGGVETTIREIAPILAENHDVSIVTGRSSHRRQIPFIGGERLRVATAPFWPRFSPPNRAAGSAVAKLDSYHIESISFFLGFLLSPTARKLVASSDVISTHYRVDSELFSRWAARRDVASVFHVQAINLGRWFKALDRSNRYVAVGNTDRDILEAISGVRMHSTVTPGIPERLLSLERDERDNVLSVGRLQPSKQPDWAIRVFQKVSLEFPSLKLVVVGEVLTRD